jgi:hypothetical protein
MSEPWGQRQTNGMYRVKPERDRSGLSPMQQPEFSDPYKSCSGMRVPVRSAQREGKPIFPPDMATHIGPKSFVEISVGPELRPRIVVITRYSSQVSIRHRGHRGRAPVLHGMQALWLRARYNPKTHAFHVGEPRVMKRCIARPYLSKSNHTTMAHASYQDPI